MGVLNVTPDSFSDGGRFCDPDLAVERALRMAREGAQIIDIGGESTRPGAQEVPAEDECRRVIPVIRRLERRLDCPISIDTRKAMVAERALAAGAAIVNDVSGLTYDPALGGVVAASGAALILMHTRGRSKEMYDAAVYGDVVADVSRELGQRVAGAMAEGVARERLILDPGVGFAKRREHSYGVLARLQEVAAALDRPLLVGPSRKSFLRDAVGDRPAAERDWGTAAAVTAAVLNGAHIVRVHAVAEMVQVVRVAEQIRRHMPQAISD
jgi:dihydropteroate synthase